jgi:hypothetical protein
VNYDDSILAVNSKAKKKFRFYSNTLVDHFTKICNDVRTDFINQSLYTLLPINSTANVKNINVLNAH